MPSPTIADAASRKPMATKRNWIKSAVKPARKGLFAAKAKTAGETTKEFAAEKKDAPGTLGKEAGLASTLMGMSKGGEGGGKKHKLRSFYSKKD